MKQAIIILVILMGFVGKLAAQTVSLNEAVQTALKNNLSVKAAGQEVQSQQSLKGTAFDLPKTNVSLMYGQYNSYDKDNNVTVTQTIPFTALGSQGRLNRANIAQSELQKAVTENDLVYQVKQTYLELNYAKARQKLLLRQDSIYAGFAKSSDLRFKTGESNLLEKATAESQLNEVRIQIRKNESTIKILRTQLRTLLNSDNLPDVGDELAAFDGTALDTLVPAANPTLRLMNQQIEVALSQKKLEAARFAPDILVGFFTQTLIGIPNTETGSGVSASGDRFTGFQVGLSLPLWFGPYRSRVRAAEYNKQVAQTRYAYYEKTLQNEQVQAVQQYSVARSNLEYYRTSALPNAELILKQADASFRSGEINYAENLIALRSALSIQENYLTTLRDFNQSIIYYEYLSGNK
ncbi:MAG: TolC family protein [Cyclobacteriaceae bacterium]|nr:TolC family protein [Cyclobacteriaceae bacterium]